MEKIRNPFHPRALVLAAGAGNLESSHELHQTLKESQRSLAAVVPE
jgi:hypothetical protein